MNNTVTISNHWLTHFGLERDPFPTIVDDSFFLLDSNRAQRLNMLYHLVHGKNALLLFTGVEGSGKTSLLKKFLAMGNDSWRYCLIQANSLMNPEQLLRHIAEGFGLEPDTVNFTRAIETIKQRLVELRRSGLTSLLLVDDAHELPAASLTMIMKIAELRDDGECLIRMVLFSEPQIQNTLSSQELSDVKHRITHVMQMPALNKKQTADYINYRFSVAGLQGRSPFSRWKINKIYKLSDGIPSRINEVASHLLHNMQVQSGKHATGMQFKPVLLGLLLVTLVVAGGYHLTNSELGGLFSPGKNSETTVALVLPKTEKPVMAPAPVAEPVPETVEPKTIVEIIEVSGSPPTSQQTADSQAALAEPGATPVRTPTSAPDPDPAPVSTPVTPAKSWVEQQDPEHYTLQIMGSRKRDLLEKFIEKQGIKENTKIITSQHKGNDWFVLVYGSYPSREKASAALSSMPETLRKSGPWPRKISDLKP